MDCLDDCLIREINHEKMEIIKNVTPENRLSSIIRLVEIHGVLEVYYASKNQEKYSLFNESIKELYLNEINNHYFN
jgi:hypothetical protein